jgi:hypothetical protein
MFVAWAICRKLGVALAATASLAAGCGESNAPLRSTVDSVASTSETSSVPALPVASSADIGYCVDYVTLKAYLGDGLWGQLWTDLNQSRTELESWCSRYVLDDPVAPSRMHGESLAIRRYLKAASEPTTTLPPPTTARPRADVEAVNACVDEVILLALGGDSSASAIWDAADRSRSTLTQRCEATILANPALGPKFIAELKSIKRFLSAPAPAPAPAPVPAPPSGGGCNPNYSGCVPIASDVDCAGGSGNGPAYVSGPVQVIGSDVYDLDRDGNGWGCE